MVTGKDSLVDTLGVALTSHTPSGTGAIGGPWVGGATSGALLSMVAVTGGFQQALAAKVGTAFLDGSSATGKIYCEATLNFPVDTGYAGVILALDAASGGGNGYYFSRAAGAWDYGKDGGGTSFGTPVASFSTGVDYVFRIEREVSGSNAIVTVFLDGVQLAQHTDSSSAYVAGLKVGVFNYDVSAVFKSIIGGTVAAAHGDVADRIDVTIDGDDAIIYVPLDYDETAGAPFLLIAHGTGVDETWIDNAVLLDKVQVALERGYIVGMSNAAGSSWGNQASVQAVVAFHSYVQTNYKVLRTVGNGISAGAPVMMNVIASKRLPGVTGVELTVPVWSLQAAHDGDDGGTDFSFQIDTAYDNDFPAAAAGYDPISVDQNLFQYWRKLRVRVVLSDDDTVIPRTAHGDLIAPRLDGYVRSLVVAEATGEHGDPSQFDAEESVDFYDTCDVVLSTGGGNPSRAAASIGSGGISYLPRL